MDKNNQQQYITIGIPTGQDELAIEIQSELSDIQTEINSGTNESQNSASYDSKKTWSYYNNEDTFIRFLGLTSYYLGLQKNLCKIINILKPKEIFEFGFGTGHTSVRIAKENPELNVSAIDLREKMVDIGKELAKRMDVSNVSFWQADMMDVVQQDLSKYDFIFLLYNFHHIEDSTDNSTERKMNSKKLEFLRNLYDNMKEGAYLCVADIFIPTYDKNDINKLFKRRVDEGYRSTFWGGLVNLNGEAIIEAERAANFCAQNEREVGIKVVKRQHEYLITRNWLQTSAQETGFEEILNADVNVVGDAIMLFKKDI